MLAVLAVSIISHFVNTLISLYFSYENYSTTQVFSGFFSTMTVYSKNQPSVSPDPASTNQGQDSFQNSDDIIMTIATGSSAGELTEDKQILYLEIYDINTGLPIIFTQSMIDTLTQENGWVQLIDDTGREIGSINKPEGIKSSYTADEIREAAGNPIRMEEFVVKAVQGKTAETEEPGTDIIYMIGMPKPDFDIKTMVEYNLNYFRYMDTQTVATTGVTLLIALILGYMLAVRLNRPVVRMTDGITAIAGGNYDVVFPQDTFYKDVYKSLNQMAAALKSGEAERKKNEKMREEWITNISHDLKTPLSSIKGYGELLYESGNELTDEELQKYIRVMLEKTTYMDALIDDLNLTQKLKNGFLPLTREKGNLVDFMREIIIGILNDPRYENRPLHFEADPEEISMEFDPLLFRRAFTNLIMNAVLHNSCDTEIWVHIRQKDGILVKICDNGTGVPEADREKIFERYYRGTNTGEISAGSGLGLAIAREIIEAHDGNIRLESAEGKGTTIIISFAAVHTGKGIVQ